MIRQVKCARCGYVWVTKTGGKYVRCPRCRAYRKPSEERVLVPLQSKS